MMTLQEKIKLDVKTAMKEKKETLQSLRVVLGELQRSTKKELSDDEVARILKKLEKNEEEMINAGKGDSKFIEILRDYIPAGISREEIESWIKDNVDFSELKNKMQAVGLVKKEFGERAEGRMISEIVKGM